MPLEQSRAKQSFALSHVSGVLQTPLFLFFWFAFCSLEMGHAVAMLQAGRWRV
jgi:hypothetical protein